MKSRILKFALPAIAVSAFAAHSARADTYVESEETVYSDPYGMEWYEPGLASGIGINVNIGGGVMGFTNSQMRDITSSVGGGWNARASFGTHIPLAFEASYVGSATNIDSVFGPGSATLLGTTLEGTLRFNILPHYLVCPYVFAGLGWQNYSIQNKDTAFAFSDTGISNSTNLMDVPLGVGLAYRQNGFVAEIRGTYRPIALGDGIAVATPVTVPLDTASLSSWDANLNVGFEW
jgi:hypothetical protein